MRHLFRRAVLGIADDPRVEAAVRRSRFSQSLVKRFVAGEDATSALTTCRAIAAEGMTTTLDQLGENVSTESAAAAAAAMYSDLLERMASEGLEPNISIKLTMLGLDVDDDLATTQLRQVLEAARRVGGFVRIDMEGSRYTERTLGIAQALHADYPVAVGTVLQSYLRRSESDLERLIRLGMRIRLVKGAYAEPPDIAFPSAEAIDASFARMMERLLDDGCYPALATHDPALIRAAKIYVGRARIPKDRFEFQMLYGVREPLQAALVDSGYRVRVYLPFGDQWYPYYARRLAERPANVAFFLRALVSRT